MKQNQLNHKQESYQLRWMSLTIGFNGFLYAPQNGLEHVLATGFVYGSPCFPDGYYIHTSNLRGIALEGSTLTVTTRNNRYRCDLAELNCEATEQDTLRSFLLENLPAPEHQAVLQNLAFQRTEDCPLPLQNDALERLTPARLAEIGAALAGLAALPNNSFVLCVDLQRAPSAFFSGMFKKSPEGAVELLLKKPAVHLGQFQDSVLCWDQEGSAFDIRYFPYRDSIRIYSCFYGDDDDGTAAPPTPYYVCNVGAQPMVVDHASLPPMGCYKVPKDIW